MVCCDSLQSKRKLKPSSNELRSKTYQQRSSICFPSGFLSSLEQTNASGCNYFGSLETLLDKFHYEEMLPRYGSDRLKVVYKETDSLLYRKKTADLYEDMSTFKHLLDLSDYPEDHFLHDKTNKKVPLTMTDELNGKVLKEVVCLRSKLYSIDYLGGTKQSANGVQKSVKKTLHHSVFKNCLLSKSVLRKEMMQLRSVGHQIVANAVNKVALSCFDDKRYILDDTVSSLAYGHYALGNPKPISSKLQNDKEKSQQT